MFMGEFEHSIDAKGRAIVPVKYREELGESFIVTMGMDGCLYLYPMKEWETLVMKLQMKESTRQTRLAQRQFMSKAMDVTLDKQGRVLIPQKLRESAGLEKDLVFIGMINHIEIWDRDTLRSQEDEENAGSLEDAMDALGISL